MIRTLLAAALVLTALGASGETAAAALDATVRDAAGVAIKDAVVPSEPRRAGKAGPSGAERAARAKGPAKRADAASGFTDMSS